MEALISRRLKSGAFQTAQDVILDALVTQDLQEKGLNRRRDATEAVLKRLGEEAFWRGVQQSYGEIAGSPQDVLVYQQEIAEWVKTIKG